jgi:hypothetical protein
MASRTLLKLALAAGLSDFDAYFGNASVGLDELFIEGRQIKLLFRFWNRLVLRQAKLDQNEAKSEGPLRSNSAARKAAKPASR